MLVPWLPLLVAGRCLCHGSLDGLDGLDGLNGLDDYKGRPLIIMRSIHPMHVWKSEVRIG